MKSLLSMIGRFVGSLTWLITALASLHIGFVFWYGESANIFYYMMDKSYGTMIIDGMLWAIGIAGIFSLLMFVAKLFKKCCPCGCDACECDESCCK
jgi:hypothetical protein